MDFDDQTFAAHILFGNTLSQKLCEPRRLFVLPPAARRPRDAEFRITPGRPPTLPFASGTSPERPFPHPSSLIHPHKRAEVFHFFANHELLAIELMALALLRFPDTPVAFRRGLCALIKDEQAHLLLYIKAMEARGLAFGELPLNGFFWNLLGGDKCLSPLDFVIHMGLTFEQANLDYAAEFAALFRYLKDHEAADVMQRIFDDEVGHVRHGLNWFRQWKDPDQDDWHAYRVGLRYPLTPARGRGKIFQREVRGIIGFSEDFSKEIEIYESNSLFPENLFIGHFLSEWSDSVGYKHLRDVSRDVLQRCQDLQSLIIFVAKGNDVCLLPYELSLHFRAQLHRCGLSMPRSLICETPLYGPGGLLSTPEPKGLCSLAAQAGCRQQRGWGPLPHQNVRVFSKSDLFRIPEHLLNDFSFSPRPSGALRVLCHTTQEVLAAWEANLQAGFHATVVKGVRGSGGGGKRVFSRGHIDIKAVTNLLRLHQSVVVEAWVPEVMSLSTVGEIIDETTIKIWGWTRFLTKQGRYFGHVISQKTFGMTTEEKNHLLKKQESGSSLFELFQDRSQQVFHWLATQGHRGPAGVDAMLWQSNSSTYMRPVVEFNTRFTMGHIAHQLAKRIVPSSVGLWIHLRTQDLAAYGFVSFSDFYARVAPTLPFTSHNETSPKVITGLIATSDPERCQKTGTFLFVFENETHANQWLMTTPVIGCLINESRREQHVAPTCL